MKVAIHQPNFCPWLPFFYKMAMADCFVILTSVQFEKGGFQNRYKTTAGKWVTKPVQHGLDLLSEKRYADSVSVVDLNMKWIYAIKQTLGIDTRIVFDSGKQFDDPTEKLIHEVTDVGGDTYLTNPDAHKKYLDEDFMRSIGLKIEYCQVPKHLQIHVFEAFEKWGIEGTIKQLKGAKCHKQQISSITK